VIVAPLFSFIFYLKDERIEDLLISPEQRICLDSVQNQKAAPGVEWLTMEVRKARTSDLDL
jgi:hypothetical protein